MVKTIKKVHIPFIVVFVCVANGKGWNELFEKNRGKLFCDSTLPNDEIGIDTSIIQGCYQ